MSQPPTDGVSKKQLAQMLAGEGKEPLSISTVEKLTKAAGIEPVYTPERIGRGKVVLYAREDAERLVRERREQKTSETQAVATRPQSSAGALVIAELLDGQRRGFESLRDVQDPWPMLMTREQVLTLSGVPPSMFDKGVRAGLIGHIGAGRATRYTRGSVRDFCARLTQASESESPEEALKTLLRKPADKA